MNTNQGAPGAQPVALQLWCETCEGGGKAYQEHQVGCHVGGDHPCPDCDGKGYTISTRYATAAAQQAAPAQPVGSLFEQFMALAETHGIKRIHDLPGLIPALKATETVQARQPLTDGERSAMWARLFSPSLPINKKLLYVKIEVFDKIVEEVERCHGITAAPSAKESP